MFTKKKRIWLVTIIFLLWYVIWAFGSTDWTIPLATMDKRTVKVMAIDADGVVAQCSGWIVNKDAGYVGTCEHCIRDAQAVTVNGRHAMVARQNRLNDQAALRTDLPADALEIPLAKRAPYIGEEVAIAGFPFPGLHFQFGRVSNARNEDGHMVLDLTGMYGDSGGPVFNPAGELVGMTKRFYFGGDSLTGIIPLDDIKVFFSPYLPKAKAE